MAAEERSSHTCRGLLSNSAEMCLDRQIYRKNPDLGNVAIITYSWRSDCPCRAAIYRVCQCIETRNRKKKGRKRTTSSTDARKEEEPARQDHPEQEGSHLNETGWKMNADRSFVDKIVREAAVKTSYTRIRRPEFRPELEQRQKMDCGKDKGRNAHFEPHWRRDGASYCPVTSSYQGFLWCPEEVDKEGWDPNKNRFWEDGLESVWWYWLNCCPKHDFGGGDELEDGCGHLTPRTTIFGP